MANLERPDEKLHEAADAIRHVAGEANRLAQTAVDELEKTATASAPGITLLGGAAFLGIAGFSSIVVGLGLALSKQRFWGPVIVGATLLGAGGVCAWLGADALPENVLPRTRRVLSQDLSEAADELR